MSDSLSSSSEKIGMSPGTLVHVGEVLKDKPKLTLVNYSKDHFEERVIDSIDDILKYKDSQTVTWLTIEGLKDVTLIESIGRIFGIHPLVLEDVLNTHQRPKLEESDEYLYVVLKALTIENEPFSVNYEQVSILLLSNLVITFKERRNALFSPIHKRLQNNKSRLRAQSSDYLTHSILDVIVDMNFTLLDALDLLSDSIEDELLTSPTPETLMKIQRAKRELIYIRKSVSPIRALVSDIMRSDNALIRDENRAYFKDVHDHAIHITEGVESYREILTGLMDIYISSVSNKMNEVMKVLTVFASIFIPLSFIAGVYGMNFDYMPELKWRWAYPTLWVFFIMTTLGLLLYFRKRKWL